MTGRSAPEGRVLSLGHRQVSAGVVVDYVGGNCNKYDSHQHKPWQPWNERRYFWLSNRQELETRINTILIFYCENWDWPTYFGEKNKNYVTSECAT